MFDLKAFTHKLIYLLFIFFIDNKININFKRIKIKHNIIIFT